MLNMMQMIGLMIFNDNEKSIWNELRKLHKKIFMINYNPCQIKHRQEL